MKKWRSVLVIYDIVDNRDRRRVVKVLESYGIRVQESAFECFVYDKRYSTIVKRLEQFRSNENISIRIYDNIEECYDVSSCRDVTPYHQTLAIF